MTDESTYLFEDNHGNIRESPTGNDWDRGRCSGIPDCCIAYYIAYCADKLRDGDWTWDGNAGLHWGYRPCPACVKAGNRITVKLCADNDGRDCTCGTWSKSRIVPDDALEDE